jgi:signal peptidase I
MNLLAWSEKRVAMAGEAESSGFARWLRIAVVGRRPKWTLVRVACLLAAACVAGITLPPIRVYGPSMEPNYPDRSINFINRWAYLSAGPQRGDVVGIRLASKPFWIPGKHALLLKRIVGLPGETVSFSAGHVCINGVPQPEPYLKYGSDWQIDGKRLGPDEYYFVGDNRTMRPEDHTKGVCPREVIVGRILLPAAR